MFQRPSVRFAPLAAAFALALVVAPSFAQQAPAPRPAMPSAPTPKPPAPPPVAAPAPVVAPAPAVAPTPAMKPPRSFIAQFLVPGSHFHGVHGIAFNQDDQLFAGSVVGQAIYRVNVDSGDVDVAVDAPHGMADDIAFAPDGTMAWTGFLTGTIYVRKGNEAPRAIATGLPGINSLAFRFERDKDGKPVKDKEPRLYASQVFLGDALWEIDLKTDKPVDYSDPAGKKQPILKDLGGLNGFEFGRDGQLYGPLWFKGQVVKIDVDKATVPTVVADGFVVPAAVDFDSKGNLYVVDTALGQIVQVDVTSGAKTLVATLKPGLDNLAIDNRDRLFVTSMVDNGIYLVDKDTGSVRTIVEGRLAIPSDIAVAHDDDGELLHLADVFAYRTIESRTGAVDTVLRMQGDVLEYPFGISVNARHVLLTSWFSGSVQRLDRKTGRGLGILHGFKAPMDAIETAKGELLVLELGTASLLRVSGADGKDRAVVAKDLGAPTALVEGTDGAVFVAETAAGIVSRIDPATGERKVVADGLKRPEGIDIGPDGRLYVAEVGERRVIAIDPATGEKSVVAGNLAIGLHDNPALPGVPPSYVTTGVAVGKSGTVYVTSDRRNAVYKLIPVR